MAGLSVIQVAKAIGVTRDRVYQYERSGRIQRGKDGKFDLAEVKRQLAANLDHRQPGAAKRVDPVEQVVPPELSLTYQQTRLTREKAATAELERKRLDGSLLDREQVRQAWSGMISAAKNALLALPDELCDVLAIESNPIRCREMMRDRIDRALLDMVDYPNAA